MILYFIGKGSNSNDPGGLELYVLIILNLAVRSIPGSAVSFFLVAEHFQCGSVGNRIRDLMLVLRHAVHAPKEDN